MVAGFVECMGFKKAIAMRKEVVTGCIASCDFLALGTQEEKVAFHSEISYGFLEFFFSLSILFLISCSFCLACNITKFLANARSSISKPSKIPYDN